MYVRTHEFCGAARLFASRESRWETRSWPPREYIFTARLVSSLRLGDEQPNSLRKSRDGAPGFAEFPLKTLFMCPPCSYTRTRTHAKAAPAWLLCFFFSSFHPSRFLGGKNWETQSWCGFISKQMERDAGDVNK